MRFSRALCRGGAAAAAVTCALTSALSHPATAHDGPERPQLTKAQRTVLIEATSRFQDPKQARRAGYLPTDACVPGMGHHWAHPRYSADAAVDPTLPEILLYVPGRRGEPVLAGVEYFKADADGRIKTDADRPTLFGHGFDGPMTGHEMPPGAPPMPVHYDLHVWLYRHNPAGELATENPQITCR